MYIRGLLFGLSLSLSQEEEINLFNKKKAAVQAQRAQSERDAMSKRRK